MAGVVVLVGLSGCASDSGVAPSRAVAVSSSSEVLGQGRSVVDPGQHAVAPVTAVKTVKVVKVKTKPAAVAKTNAKVQTKTGKVRSAAANRVQVETVPKPVAKMALKPSPVKAAPKPSPAKAITKPVTRPAPQPVTKPAPPKKPVAATFAAPTVHYSGATCRKTSANTWSITHTWTASGGTYADLGSAQHRITPVTVTGSTRTWTFVTSESGSSAPEVTDAYLGRIIAPIGQTSDISQWRSVERQVDMVQVRC